MVKVSPVTQIFRITVKFNGSSIVFMRCDSSTKYGLSSESKTKPALSGNMTGSLPRIVFNRLNLLHFEFINIVSLSMEKHG